MKVMANDLRPVSAKSFTNTPAADGYGKESGNGANAEDSYLLEVVG